MYIIMHVNVYPLNDLGVSRNLIGSLSLVNEHYLPPTERIMRDLNKYKMSDLNSSFASVSESEILRIQEYISPGKYKEGYEIWPESFQRI